MRSGKSRTARWASVVALTCLAAVSLSFALFGGNGSAASSSLLAEGARTAAPGSYPLCSEVERTSDGRYGEPCLEYSAAPEGVPECTQDQLEGTGTPEESSGPPKIDPMTGYVEGACWPGWRLVIDEAKPGPVSAPVN